MNSYLAKLPVELKPNDDLTTEEIFKLVALSRAGKFVIDGVPHRLWCDSSHFSVSPAPCYAYDNREPITKNSLRALIAAL